MSERRTRKPVGPGEVLQEEFLEPYKMSQGNFAAHLGCDVKTVNRLVNAKTRLTPVMAARIAAASGTTPEFWMNLQTAVDLYEVYQVEELPEPLMETSGRAV